MTDFLSCDLNVTDIAFAIYVDKSIATTVHKNRPSHGLMINASEAQKKYIFSDGKIITVRQNEILYMPKNSSYTVESERRGECYAINFELEDGQHFDPFVFKPKNAAVYFKHFEKAHLAWKNRSGPYRMKCKAYLYEILILMQTEGADEHLARSTSSVIDPALSYIHSNYTSCDMNIPDLAALCGISEDYFRKIFKKRFKTSPTKYINDLKLNYAKELLHSGLLSVSRIAELSGFGDPAYFSREFKKAFGTSPRDYK